MPTSDLYGWFPPVRQLTTLDDRHITTPENAPHALTGDATGMAPSMGLLGPSQMGAMSQQAFNLAGRPSMMPNAGSMLPYSDYPDSGGGGGAGAGAALGLLNQANQANNLYQQGAGLLGGVSSSVGSGAMANGALADAGFGGSSAGVVGSGVLGATGLGGNAAAGAAAYGDAAAGIGALGSAGLGAGAAGAGAASIGSGVSAGSIAGAGGAAGVGSLGYGPAAIIAIGPIMQNLMGDNQKHAISQMQAKAAQEWMSSQGITPVTKPTGQAAPFGIQATATTYLKNGQPFDYTAANNRADFQAWAKAHGYDLGT